MKILRTYILKELLGPFILSIIIFTFVLVMGNLIKLADLVINKGIGIIAVGRLFLYLIPYLLSYTIPMAILTATLLVFGRLSSEGEITTMKASGVNLYRIAFPIAVVGLIMSLLSIPLNDTVLPKAHFASRRIVKEIGLKNPAAFLEPGTFIKSFPGYILFVYGIDGNKLSNIRIYQPQEGKPTRTIIARKGEFISSPEHGNVLKLKLINGTSDEPDPNNPGRFYKLSFKTYYLSLDLGDMAAPEAIEKKPKDMCIEELMREAKQLEARGINPTPLLAEAHKKVSLSFASLAFMLIGLPLAMIARRGERAAGFGISLGIIILYYILLLGAEALALKGIWHPGIGVWAPNFLLITAGLFLTYRMVEK